ncbi:MAG TPA: hypothetical protein VFB12_07540 [Ktedonobacteraceae bacterium]|nr:hypothetical protein [Ktedonobacteraceae bacterium]
MAAFASNGRESYKDDDEEFGEEEYDTLELLERLETLREDMEDLGVTTLQEVIQRIEELHSQLDTRS